MLTKAALDREAATSHTITVGVSDGKDANNVAEDPPVVDNEIPVEIAVVDVDEPPDISFAATPGDVTVNNDALAVDENYEGRLATFSASDPENEPGLTYEWSVGGTDGGAFSITDAGVLSFAAVPDFENSVDSSPPYNVYGIKVSALDSDGMTGALQVTVTVPT